MAVATNAPPPIPPAQAPHQLFLREPSIFLASDIVCLTLYGKVNPVMKNIQSFFSNITRKSRPVCQQMELPLIGARLTRDEANFLCEIRRLREQLAKA